MDISGVTWLWLLLCVAVVFIKWRSQLTWFELTSMMKKRGRRLSDPPRTLKVTRHWCSEPDCRFCIVPQAYSFLGMTADSYWLHHWLEKHAMVPPIFPYTEVVHEEPADD